MAVVFNLDGTVTAVNDTFAENTIASGTSSFPIASEGIDLYNLAYGREWRSGGSFTPGGPVNAAFTLANTIMASNIAGVHDLVNNVDTSAHSTGATNDTATVVATMSGTFSTNLVASYSDTGTSTTGDVLNGLRQLAQQGAGE